MPVRRFAAGLLLAVAAGVAAAQDTGRCPDFNPLRNVYAGDLHVHTAFSLDAATQDTRARPADAYRFARGEPLAVQPYDEQGRALRELRLRRALDFAAVTDHAELLGEVSLCQTPGSATYDSWQCLLYRHVPRAAYYLFNYTASRTRRLGNCGADGAVCREAAAGPWQRDPPGRGRCAGRQWPVPLHQFRRLRVDRRARRERRQHAPQRDLPWRRGAAAADQLRRQRQPGNTVGDAR